MQHIEIFLWISVVLSGAVLFGYEIWNIIVVSKDLIRISRKAQRNSQP